MYSLSEKEEEDSFDDIYNYLHMLPFMLTISESIINQMVKKMDKNNDGVNILSGFFPCLISYIILF